MPVHQIVIREKAESIFNNLKNEDIHKSSVDETFLTSNGWFARFKMKIF